MEQAGLLRQFPQPSICAFATERPGFPEPRITINGLLETSKRLQNGTVSEAPVLQLESRSADWEPESLGSVPRTTA